MDSGAPVEESIWLGGGTGHPRTLTFCEITTRTFRTPRRSMQRSLKRSIATFEEDCAEPSAILLGERGIGKSSTLGFCRTRQAFVFQERDGSTDRRRAPLGASETFRH